MRAQELTTRRDFLKWTSLAALAGLAAACAPTAAPAPTAEPKKEAAPTAARAEVVPTLEPTKAPAAQTGGKVVAWMWGGTPAQIRWEKDQLSDFEKQTGLKVEYVERDWAKQREDILSALTSGAVPDVGRTHSKYVAEFGDSGDLKALEDFPDFPKVAETMVPSYLATLENKGKHYGLVESVYPFILAANQPMLDKAEVKVPANWDDFREAVKKLAKPDQGIYGYTIPGGVNLDAAYRWIPWLFKSGGRCLSKDMTEPTFNSDAGVAALEMLVELQKAKAIPPGNAAYAFAENADLWGSEKAAMSTEGPWWQSVLEGQYKWTTEQVKAKLTIAGVPAPATPIGSEPSATLLDVIMYTMFSKGKNLDGGWLLLKHWEDPERSKQRTSPANSEGLPGVKSVYEPGVTWEFVGKDAYFKEAESVEIWPNHPKITEIQMKIAEGLNAAFSGTVKPKDALDKAAEAAAKLMKE